MAKTKILQAENDAELYAVRQPTWPDWWDVSDSGSTKFSVHKSTVGNLINLLTQIEKESN